MSAAELDDRTFSHEHLLARVREVVERAQRVPVVASEELEGPELESLRRDVAEVIEDALELLSRVLARYEQPAADEVALDVEFEMCGEVERRLDADDGVTRITSVAFVAQIGLRNRMQSLSVVGPDRKWELIAACSSAVREVQKSVSAVELAVAEHHGVAPSSRYYVSELERSLRVRKAYVVFRSDVLGDKPPDPLEVTRRLRGAASAIAKLVGRPAYAFARVHDRWQIRQFQQRIRHHLCERARVVASGEDTHSVDVAGVRLWQDLANLAELILQINQRAELREHDRGLFARALEALTATNVPETLALLSPTLGRDPDLDEAIQGRCVVDAAWLADVLSRCGETLARVPSRAQDSGPSSSRRRTDRPCVEVPKDS